MGHESHVERPGLLLLSRPSFLYHPNLLYEMVSGMDASRNFDAPVRIECGVETSPDAQFSRVGMSDARESKPSTIGVQ